MTRDFEPISDRVEHVATQIVNAAFRIHSELGPGLLESVYEICMCHELSHREIAFRRQFELPIEYRGLRLDGGLKIDLLVDDSVVVELKAVDKMLPVFEAQLLSYLKLSGRRLGLLINFNVPRIKDGIKRIVL